MKNCENVDDEIALKFFEMIFEAKSEKKKIYNLTNEETHNFWRLYFATKLAKEKFDILCSDPIDKKEIENSHSTDFNDFIWKSTPTIRRKIILVQ